MAKLKTLLIATPWCCVAMFSLPLFSISGSLGMLVDAAAHIVLIPASVAFHTLLTIKFMRSAHQHSGKRIEKMMLTLGWIVVIMTALFHFTPLHDLLVHS